VKRSRLWYAIEVGLGLLVLLLVATGGRFLIRVWLIAVLDAAASLGPLLRVDGAATSWLLALAVGRMALAILPSVILILSVPRHRWLWLIPPLAMLAIISTPLSFTACATIDRWLLLALLSGVAAALARVRLLRWVVVLPFVVLWEVVPSHGLLGFADVGTRDPAYRERLLAECSRRAGARPENLSADHLMPYHGINPLADDLVFLAGEGPEDGGMRGRAGGRRVGSWWLRRTDGGFRFELPSNATGNLWRGCVLDGTLWMARAGQLIGVRRLTDPGSAHEQLHWLPVPSPDMDLLDTACDPNRGRVYVTEYLNGGLWEVALGGAEPRRFQIGGGMLIPRWRSDGRLLLTNSASLIVFDPDEQRVIERVPVGLATLSFDVCGTDGAVAAGDLSGRLRVFEIDGAGKYRLAWGVSLFAPRRVAYSPDCSRIAVASADDRRVFIVDARARRVADVYRAGPALREVATTGPREFSVSDVCSMTTYRW
jgi:hypothetical protein